VAFVFGMVGVMGALCLGVAALVLTAGGRDMNPDAPEVSVQAKAIAVVVILVVCGIGGWLTWRFARLLKLARNAVNQPEPEVASSK
jgi:Flp pilus assembly pilin Flp